MLNKKSAILLVSAVFAAALAAGAWITVAHREEILTDGLGIEIPSSNANPRDILWQPPKAVDAQEIPETAVAGSASPETDRFAFSAPGPNGDLDLFEMVRADEARWITRRLTTASSSDQDTTPYYSPDGKWIWFASDRPGGEGGYDLWRAPSTVDGWGDPEYVESDLIQTRGDETSPSLASGGGLLAFARRSSSTEPADLVLIDLEDETSDSEVTHQLNSLADDRSPAFSPAGDFLYFASDRSGGSGGHDLYRARFSGASFDDPTWLGEEVNTEADETDPAIDTAGFRMRFRSTTAGVGSYRETTAREIYRSVRAKWPSFGIGSQLMGLLPWILAALALVLLFAALRQLASRDHWQRRWGTLGLMARCAFASMAIHALLAVLLSLWQVDNGLPFNEENGEMRVALTTRSSMNDIAAQLQAPTLSTRSTPQDNTRPQSVVPTEVTEQKIMPVELAVSAMSSYLRDAAVSQDMSTVPPPAKGEPIRSSLQALPVASKTRGTEPRSQQQSLDFASDQSWSETSERRSNNLQPAEYGEPVPIPGMVSEADTAIEYATTIDAVPPMSPTLQSPAMPSGDRAASTEQSSQPIAATQGPSTEVPVKTNAPDTVALPYQAASVPPTSATLPDTHTRPTSHPSDRSADQPLLEHDFIALEMPTIELAGTEPDRRTATRQAGGFSPAPPAPAGSRDTFLDPQEAPNRTLSQQVNEASPGAAPPSFPALPTSTELTHGVLPAAKASSDSIVSPLVELASNGVSPPPIVAPNASSIRSGGVSSELPPLFEELSDVMAPREKRNTLRLALIIPNSDQPVLPIAPATPTISGVVLDAATGEPIQDSLVRLDGEADTLRKAQTGEDGRFVLTPAQLPDFVVLTASADGYTSLAANVAKSDAAEGVWIEFRLQPMSRYDIALDDDPRVHHLGNDEFTGAINSQFQVKSEGTLYTTTFVLDRAQLTGPVVGAELRTLVRGAQNRNPITVNGHRLTTTMTDSPPDGSFGMFTARIPLPILREGENVIQIRATDRQGTDIDDFEFVNPRLVLLREQRRRPNSF